jgi:hypothetical protein
MSFRISAPNGKVTSLFCAEPTTTTTLLRRTFYTISGTTITPNTTSAGYATLYTTSNALSVGTNYIQIIKVLGYY